MYYSSYNYYYLSLLKRLVAQKHFSFSPFFSSISMQISNGSLLASEDFEILNALKTLEVISGQKGVLVRTGSKYIGTSKKSYFLARLELKKISFFSFLEELSYFLLPSFVKRHGLFLVNLKEPSSFFSVCFKHMEVLNTNSFAISLTLKSNLLIKLCSSVSSFAFLDVLQSYKFFIKQ